jgi:hypothetical protein
LIEKYTSVNLELIGFPLEGIELLKHSDKSNDIEEESFLYKLGDETYCKFSITDSNI